MCERVRACAPYKGLLMIVRCKALIRSLSTEQTLQSYRQTMHYQVASSPTRNSTNLNMLIALHSVNDLSCGAGIESQRHSLSALASCPKIRRFLQAVHLQMHCVQHRRCFLHWVQQSCFSALEWKWPFQLIKPLKHTHVQRHLS